MIFDDFELTITAAEPPADGANVIVRGARQETGSFSLAAVAEAVGQLNTAMQQRQPTPAVLEQTGARLFNALFAGKVRDAWRESWTIAQTRQHGLRLHLYSTLPAVMAVPWEYLYDPDQLGWLTLRADLSLVRTLPVAQRESPPVTDRLRVLVMLANPQGLATLDSAQEWTQLQMLADNTAALEFMLVKPTYAALQEALRQQAIHVFHFVGHGGFGTDGDEAEPERRHLHPVGIDAEPADPQGILFFANEQGAVDPIPADKLAPLLTGCKTLRLVFLNACQGAATGTRSAFAGVAQQLLRQAVPAVLAMQTPIYDDHAIRFSREFYAALADGLNLEEAVSQGRKRINEVAYSWGIPAFYFQGQEPFVIPPLSDTEKVIRLWQNAQRLSSVDAPERLRRLVETVLKLDPTNVAAHQQLERLKNAEEATRLYTVALTYHTNQQWREAHRTLQQVEGLVPNFRDTRWLLAEALGKLGNVVPVLSTSYTEQPRLYQSLLNALRDGRLVPFLGWEVSRFGRPAQDRWVRGQYLPGADEIAQELAQQLPEHIEGVYSLPQISQYTTLWETQEALYDRLHELYRGDYQPTILHRLLAELPRRLRVKGYPVDSNRRFVIFSTAFDNLLERAFVAEGQPYHLFAYRHPFIDAQNVEHPERFFHYSPEGKITELIKPNEYTDHDQDRYPIIVKLCGQGVISEPYSVVITEDQYLEYLPAQEIGKLLPMTLCDQVKRCSFLFFGHSLQPWHFRLLWLRMRLQNRPLYNKGWAILPTPTEIEQRFWRNYGIDPLMATPEGMVAYVNTWLDRLEALR